MPISSLPTTRRRFPAVLAAALALAAVVSAVVVPAGAAVAQDAPTPPPNQWALTPTGDNPAEPGTRTNFSYELAPGASATDSLTVWNYGTEPAGFQVYATDAYNTPEGAFDLVRGGVTPTDAGAWVQVAENAVIVPPKSGMTVPMTVSVPAGATPGDHAGGIVASIQTPSTDSSGRTVLVDHRVGAPVYVRVNGPLNPALSIDELATTYRRSATSFGGGDVEVTYTVHNTGNVRLAAHQKVTVSGPFGLLSKVQGLDDLPELLPGTTITRTATVSGVLPLVRLTTKVTLDPFSAAPVDPPPDAVSRSQSIWAFPWMWFAVLGLLAVLLALVIWRRTRRGGLGAGPAAPVGGPGPGAARANTPTGAGIS